MIQKTMLKLYILTILLLFQAGCTAIKIEHTALGYSQSLEKSIVGQWQKAYIELDQKSNLEYSQKCQRQYPDNLEFFDEGIYMISREDSLKEELYLQWQSGDYQVIQNDRIHIQSATDAMEEYRISITDSTKDEILLTFVDDDGCEFVYKRSS